MTKHKMRKSTEAEVCMKKEIVKNEICKRMWKYEILLFLWEEEFSLGLSFVCLNQGFSTFFFVVPH